MSAVCLLFLFIFCVDNVVFAAVGGGCLRVFVWSFVAAVLVVVVLAAVRKRDY